MLVKTSFPKNQQKLKGGDFYQLQQVSNYKGKGASDHRFAQ